MRELRRDRRLLEKGELVLGEGVHVVLEALASGARLEVVVVSPRLNRVPGGAALEEALARSGVETVVAADEAVSSVQDARSPQPVVALVRLPRRTVGDVLAGRGGAPLVVVADGVQDPGNLGSLLRSADAAGATAFVVTGAGADLRHPRAVRATMGSIFRLPAASADPVDVSTVLARSGIPVVAADPHRGSPYDLFDWRPAVALVFGGEGAGPGEPWMDAASTFVTIPMHPGVESLSVPAAAAVLLFEAARQRRVGR